MHFLLIRNSARFRPSQQCSCGMITSVVSTRDRLCNLNIPLPELHKPHTCASTYKVTSKMTEIRFFMKSALFQKKCTFSEIILPGRCIALGECYNVLFGCSVAKNYILIENAMNLWNFIRWVRGGRLIGRYSVCTWPKKVHFLMKKCTFLFWEKCTF